ncbi:MAG: aminodeoxychorismate synthase component I [Armatimonadota bacterium]
MIALFERAGKLLLEDVPGRTAIIAAEPDFVLTSKNGVTTRSDGAVFDGDPLDVLKDQLARFRQDVDRNTVPFAGGAMGYFSYDLGRSLERVPERAVEDVPTPDYCLGFYDSALHIDLNNEKCMAVSWSGNAEAIDYWRGIAMETQADAGLVDAGLVHCPGIGDDLTSNFTRGDYIRAIERVKEYIAAGDVYQVNLTQRFQTELTGSPWELYKALRRINPAPKCCYIDLGGLVLASASPETFVTYDPVTRVAVTKPIKGTRPRGKSALEDAHLAQELAQSEKDRAENVMIVDMERNDLGRVAAFGSVRVPKLWEIEPHPNVFQMVSTVEAELAEGYGPVDLIRAAFPGGSITGAPKVRAMEIIEELEPHRRGIYTGSAGFIDFTGRVDLSIVIRSFIIDGSTAYFHAGGGIVIDSDPESEYQETLDKISGLRAALKQCEVNT